MQSDNRNKFSVPKLCLLVRYRLLDTKVGIGAKLIKQQLISSDQENSLSKVEMNQWQNIAVRIEIIKLKLKKYYNLPTLKY